MLVSELILDSYQLAGIIDPSEQVDGYYLQTGLKILNRMLASFSQASSLITFVTEVKIPLVLGKHSYTVGMLPGTDIKTQPIQSMVNGYVMNGNVKVPLREVFTNQDSINNYAIVSGLPREVYMLQSDEKTEVRFYPSPYYNTEATLIVRQMYPQLEPFETTAVIATHAHKAFHYQLAKDLGIHYQYPLTQNFLQEYQSVMNLFMAYNVQDMPVKGDDMTNNTLWYGNPWGYY